MLTQRKLPEFASADWYSDPSDHRCPHDSWLESFEFSEPAKGERKENRRSEITLRLLGAYHDGAIVFRYSGVKKFSVASESSERGLGDWIEDQFSITSDGAIRHDITWCFGSDTKSAWFIEAEDVSYEWIPKKG